jgi:hypothetical protein
MARLERHCAHGRRWRGLWGLSFYSDPIISTRVRRPQLKALCLTNTPFIVVGKKSKDELSNSTNSRRV